MINNSSNVVTKSNGTTQKRALEEYLEKCRNASRTEREKGTYFERLAVAFLQHDAVMSQQYEEIYFYADWAKKYGDKYNVDSCDTGIDIVAKIRNEDSFCAIQCKCYHKDHTIQKADIDSFFTASSKSYFSRRILIDTTYGKWGKNAEKALENTDKEFSRITIDNLVNSSIDWVTFLKEEEIKVADKKQPRPHQKDAIAAVRKGFQTADRGKLIMACGTGKTFTGLKIAEDIAGKGKMVLFLVPSLALMSQTIREWSIDTTTPLRSFAVCSDNQVGKRKNADSDIAEIEMHDLEYPATTDAAKLAEKVKNVNPSDNERMTVVFSTYQSIQVISEAQKNFDLPEFDIIICDEAHRTTGATLQGEEESNFVKIHNNEFIKGKKRLYMTATPRVFGDSVKSKSKEASAVLCSMDDESLYGTTFFARGFGWAVENKLLTDYKVLVLAVDEKIVSASLQNRLSAWDSELQLTDATKIIGCYKALIKHEINKALNDDLEPMRSAIAFCKDIKSSKLVRDEFTQVITEYLNSEYGQAEEGDGKPLNCELEHVDGTMGAKERNQYLSWLKDTSGGENQEPVCRILTNARCLSEGVDVPGLDGILFMHPRKSPIDVVQSVGRVMRRAEGKKMGYVILPIAIPANKTAEEALNDNDRYKVVWQVLNALRSHDERFDSTINKIELGEDVSSRIEVVAISNNLPNKKDETMAANIGHGSSDYNDGDGDSISEDSKEYQTSFIFDEISKGILAKIAKKCGTRVYWEDWATDIAKIAQTHITRITTLVEKTDSKENQAFNAFLEDIRNDINDSITKDEAIEMLAQHIITRPVFDALFEDYDFAKYNPVSKALQSVLDILDEHNLEKESESLKNFYDSVKLRVSGIETAEAKQKIIVELYDKFFRNAFPKMTEKLGIVYTPVEIVDFIIASVNDVLQKEFNQTLGSKGVHILDPFTGTGTFITRLLKSGLIKPDELEHKLRNEIHANELVLLAYYIAAINIESTYHSIAEQAGLGSEYLPFEGICLTDTFQLYEKSYEKQAAQQRLLADNLMADNHNRRSRQIESNIDVIIGNPPYSAGQKSENDNASNLSYPLLDKRIAETYVQHSKAGLSKSLYDSYIRAIRWASDRIKDKGIIAYVSNAGWVDSNSADGLRKCLAEEFSNLYIFHLRGNARTSGEQRRKEKDNVFGQGTRTPVAITIMVKNPNAESHGQIFFHDIGNYLNRTDKLNIISNLKSINGINAANGWQLITPDQHGDWLNQRDDSFNNFLPLGIKTNKSTSATAQLPPLFENYSLGIATNRDSWVYNSSATFIEQNMTSMINFYNQELHRFNEKYPNSSSKERSEKVNNSINNDPHKISWSRALKQDVAKNKGLTFYQNSIAISLYRPFTKQYLYYNRRLNEVVYQMPKIFPLGHNDIDNKVIQVSGTGARDFSIIMSSSLPDLNNMPAGGQCYPRYIYEVNETNTKDNAQQDLFSAAATNTVADGGLTRRDGITDEGLAHFQAAYPNENISKDDLFYYTYAILHSEDYRSRYSDTISKQLPRIPAVKKAEDFWAFVQAGRKLGELHCKYENVDPYPVDFIYSNNPLVTKANPEVFYRVEKMKFAGKRPNLDKSTIIYNPHIAVSGIPLEAYDYVVNGKSPIEWVMERQCVKTDKDSGITNDSNRYAIETAGDPAYPLKLLQRVITVSLETLKIVKNLPPLGDLS